MSNGETLTEWIRSGPRPEDGTLGWAIGTLLHWRMWGMLIVYLTPFFVGMYALGAYSGYWAVLLTWFLATMLIPYAMKVSPKYEVTKNY